MADWRKVALAAFLADGQIDDTEVKILKKELWEDGTITFDEVDFLIELREHAMKKLKSKGEALNPKFEKLFFDAVESNILKDGSISANETDWLRKHLLADGKIDAGEMELLNRLKKKATKTSPEFEALYLEMKGKYDRALAKAAKK